MRSRVRECIEKIGTGQPGAVVIATHRVICKVIVLSCLGIDNSHFWDMRFDPASITLLEGKDDKFSLAFANDTCHLREGMHCFGIQGFLVYTFRLKNKPVPLALPAAGDKCEGGEEG